MNPWQAFFKEHAASYDNEIFVQNTAAEIPFLVKELELRDGAQVLDVGCGTGRHSAELARLGYRMTGVDLSPDMLAVASKRAADASVEVELVNSNAADFVRPDAFDAAICLCEGAMCLLGPDDDDLQRDQIILGNVFRSLRPGGRFLFNVLNACRMIRLYNDDDVVAGKFDPVELVEYTDPSAVESTAESSAPASNPPTARLPVPRSQDLRERGYTAPEIRRMVLQAGFELLGLYGGTAGDWGHRPPKMDEYELMIVARRPV